MKELELVALKHDISEHGLCAEDVGTIVHVYPPNEAFEVEFVSAGGSTVAVLTLKKSDIRTIKKSEIYHVRQLSIA